MILTQSFQRNTKQLSDCLLLLMEADGVGVMDGWMDRVKSGKPLFQSFLFIRPYSTALLVLQGCSISICCLCASVCKRFSCTETEAFLNV